LQAGLEVTLPARVFQSGGSGCVTKDVQSINGQSVVIFNEVVPAQGEDGFAAQTDALGGLLCVADGCGGIGSRRYAKLDNHTEAYVAARLAVEGTQAWASALNGQNLPQNAAEAGACAASLAASLGKRFVDFHAQYHNVECSRIIMRGLQRTLPTTLCAALIDARAHSSLSCVFFWAGDSRGYIFSPEGLRQCTADHVVGQTNALDNLYRDSRLSNMVNAETPFHIDAFGLTTAKPCAVVTATDGAFSYLPTPMEFELLLLKTLEASSDLDGWRTRLGASLAGFASDDATLAMACYGADTFDAFRNAFEGRRAALQAQFVTPVRRRRQNIDYARTLWESYRENYELSEEVRHADWRL